MVTCQLTGLSGGPHTVTIPVTAPDGTPNTECTAYNNQASVTSGVSAETTSNQSSVTVTGCIQIPQTGSIRVEKVAYDTNGAFIAAGSFTFLVDSVAQAPAVAGAGLQTYGGFSVGSPAVTEQGQSGWTNLCGATLNKLQAESCRSAFTCVPSPSSLSQSVNASVNTEVISTVCWLYQQTAKPTPPPSNGDGGTDSSTPTPTPQVQVLGSNAQIVKVRSSADPARVGERVNFTATLSITGDTTVTGTTVTDTFEHAYLRFVSATPAGCTVAAGVPDATHSLITCPAGDVTPGTIGNPGTKSVAYQFVFDALQATPSRTVNSAAAKADLDGTGPHGLANIGPTVADVAIIDLPATLPKAGAGILRLLVPAMQSWMVQALVVLVASATLGAGSTRLNRRRL
ncbi:MAG: hypothetical protein EXR66_09060 [Dehalococcoidia bacterium]|nr:hypothetical protein [Dehalococcoidia bacterium]